VFIFHIPARHEAQFGDIPAPPAAPRQFGRRWPQAFKRPYPDRAIITTPYPTVEQVAKSAGVPPERVAELMRLADEIVAGNTTRKPAKKGRPIKKRAATTSRTNK
jgi:hypothetical protein